MSNVVTVLLVLAFLMWLVKVALIVAAVIVAVRVIERAMTMYFARH